MGERVFRWSYTTYKSPFLDFEMNVSFTSLSFCDGHEFKKRWILTYVGRSHSTSLFIPFNVGILTLWTNTWIDSSVKMWRGWKDVNGKKRQSYRQHFRLWLWTTNFAQPRKTFSLTLEALPRTNSLVTWEKWREGKISETIHLPVP